MVTTTTVKTAAAVGYFRVSGSGQAGERHVSLEVQEAACNDYCRAHGLTLMATFTDVASGRKDDRAQYRAMLAYTVEHGIDNIIVLYLDRFGRNPREILRRYWQLQESGVTVQSVREDLQEELMLLIRAGIAGQESKRTAERVSMSLLKAASKGTLVNKLPFGYVKVRDQHGQRVEQVPEEAEVVREAVELAIGNRGYKSIADALNARGHRTKNGKFWATQTVKLLLTNPAIAGHFVFRGATETVEHRDVYPAIVTAEEWDRLQERLTFRRENVRGKAATSDYLLSGLLRCGHCGGAMAGSSKGPGKHGYYLCANRKMSAHRCTEAVSHRKDALESAVLEYLGQYSVPNAVRQLLEAQGQEKDTKAESELVRTNKRLAELQQAFLNDLDRVDRGILNEPEYMTRQEVRREEQEGLQSRTAELEATVAAQRDMEDQVAVVPVKVRSFLEAYRDMDMRQNKAHLQAIIRAAHLFNDGRIVLEFRA